MSSVEWRELSPERVDPERLALLLARNGWTTRGGQAGLYSRWVFEGDEDQMGHRLILPLDPGRADYADLLSEALAELRSMAPEYGSQVAHVLSGLVDTPGDEVKFRKLTTTTRGAVPWPTGEELVISSRNALLAAAKSRVTKMPYYGNRAGRFAHRYLQSVLMGQTEIGSYVVVAYTPVEEVFYEKESKQGLQTLPNIGAHTGREITRSLAAALEATTEAVEHFQSTASMTGFDDAVTRGVSKEFAEAVKGMVENAEGAEISIDWVSGLQATLDAAQTDDVPASRNLFEFSSAIKPVLDRAITRLASMTPPELLTATGWVSVVERPKRGAPGVVRLKVLAGSEAKTLRVRLTEDQFDVATDAIKHQQVLAVSGRQEKEGRNYWLYDATELHAIDLVESRASKNHPQVASGQLTFESESESDS